MDQAGAQRLGSLSWFMKCQRRKIRNPKSEIRNKSEIRMRASARAEVPEASAHTSIKERVDHVAAQGRTEDLKAARTSSAVGSKQAAGLEEKLWLCPVEDRRRIDSPREGMIEGFALGSYLLLVDYTARLFREGKASLSREMAEILDRLHTSAEQWHARLDRLRTGRPLGRFFAATRARLREIGTRLNLKHVPNLGGCPVT